MATANPYDLTTVVDGEGLARVNFGKRSELNSNAAIPKDCVSLVRVKKTGSSRITVGPFSFIPT